MTSTMPTNFSIDPVHINPFENGFTPWELDYSDLFSVIQPSPNRAKSVECNSGSSESNPNRNHVVQTHANSNSGSKEPNSNQYVSVVDERKRRRMISNRESARRSRLRKQKHVENLRDQLTRLRIANRELTNRLQIINFHNLRVQTDSHRLRSEHIVLRQRLSEISKFLHFRQLEEYSSTLWNNI